MTKHKSHSRKTNKVVRMPATKFAHLRKRIRKSPKKVMPKTKQHGSGSGTA